MQIKISEKGTPYIDLERGRFIFSRNTAHPIKGYKFMCYVGSDTKSVCVSSAKAKVKKYSKVVEDIAFTVRLKDFRRSNDLAFPKKEKVISNISLNYLKKIVNQNMIDEFLPFESIPKIMQILMIENDSDEWDDDPTLEEEEEEEEVEKRNLKKSNGIKRGKPLKIKVKPKFKIGSIKKEK